MELVWFKDSDLRVRDHEPLFQANKTNNKLIHIFIWDCRWDDKTSNDISNMSKIKKKFLKECLINLETNLKKVDIELNVFFGITEDIITNLVIKHNITKIYCYQSIDIKQKNIDAKIIKNTDINISYFWGHTANHLCDISYNESNFPKSFTNYKKNITKNLRNEFFTKSNKKSIKLDNSIPIQDIDIPYFNNNFTGGEDVIWALVKNHFYENYDHKNINVENLMEFKYSYKPWLTFGCISYKSLF